MEASTGSYAHQQWKVLWEQLIYKAFHEVNIVTARAGTARGTSGIISFEEKDPDATLLYIWQLINRKLEMNVIVITDIYRSVKSF